MLLQEDELSAAPTLKTVQTFRVAVEFSMQPEGDSTIDAVKASLIRSGANGKTR